MESMAMLGILKNNLIAAIQIRRRSQEDRGKRLLHEHGNCASASGGHEYGRVRARASDM
jgi:hypothetical protein